MILFYDGRMLLQNIFRDILIILSSKRKVSTEKKKWPWRPIEFRIRNGPTSCTGVALAEDGTLYWN